VEGYLPPALRVRLDPRNSSERVVRALGLGAGASCGETLEARAVSLAVARSTAWLHAASARGRGAANVPRCCEAGTCDGS
jgi:hypothetical protein